MEQTQKFSMKKREWERTRPSIEEFVNKSLFQVVELKQSIPRHQFM